MDQKLSKIEELKALVTYAKEAKLLKVKVEGYEFELHPLALQDDLSMVMPDKETLEELEMKMKAEAMREAEDLLYYSANSGRA
jgi:DNA-binding protein YbaB